MPKPVVPPRGPPPVGVGKTDLDAMILRGRSNPSAIRTLRCRTVASGHLRQMNYIRNLPPQPVMEDEPAFLSGESAAPNASEALLAAFGSCLAVGIHANALVQGIPITVLELELSADVNTTSVWGAGDLTPKAIGFEAIHVSVRLEADAPRKALEALVSHATLWSPVANTLHNPVYLDVRLAPEIVPAV
jgi:uncharacterized OsmC-like protein